MRRALLLAFFLFFGKRQKGLLLIAGFGLWIGAIYVTGTARFALLFFAIMATFRFLETFEEKTP